MGLEACPRVDQNLPENDAAQCSANDAHFVMRKLRALCDWSFRKSKTHRRAHPTQSGRRFGRQTAHQPTRASDRASRGVSDPGGHARGHCKRTRRGRSRHGFLL
jgi:hypothetical protein